MPLPMTVRPRSSRKLALLLVASHFGALLTVAITELPDWLKPVLLVLIATSLWHVRHCLGGSRRIVSLTLRDQGVAEFIRANNESGEAGISLQSTVTPLLTLVLLRQQGRLEALVLLPDSLSQDDYRRLRLWLRWQTIN